MFLFKEADKHTTRLQNFCSRVACCIYFTDCLSVGNHLIWKRTCALLKNATSFFIMINSLFHLYL